MAIHLKVALHELNQIYLATDYHWQVRTSCNSTGTNVSEWSDTIVFQTLTPCAVPANPNESTIGLDFADLTWDTVSSLGLLRYRKSGSWIFDTTLLLLIIQINV